MDEEVQKLIKAVAFSKREGSARDELVEELIMKGLDPQSAQNVTEMAQLWLVGQGDYGYQRWFWAILSSKTHMAKGAGWLWLLTLVCLTAALPLTLALVQSLPSGRYPILLLALPALLVSITGANIIGYGLFTWITRRPSKKETT